MPLFLSKKFSLYQSILISTILVLAAGKTAYAGDVYSFGVVPQYEPRETYAIWQPILREVERETGLKLRLSVSSSIPEFESSFESGRYDFAYMNPYHLLVANKSQGYQPLIRDISRKLYGILVVHKDSPIQEVEQLAGKTVAFPAPNALGAALIPRAELENNYQTKVVEKYVRSHSSVYLNVALGVVDAGGGVQKTLAKQPKSIRDKLRVIYETTKLAPHPIAVHPRVKAEVCNRVLEAFQKLDQSGKGQDLLKKIPIQKVGPAVMADYLPLKEMGLESFYVKD